MKTLLRMVTAGIVPVVYLLAWPGARDPYHTVMALGAYAIVGLVVLLWHQRQAASEQALAKRASARTRQLMKQASGDSFVVSLLKGLVQGAVVLGITIGLVFAVAQIQPVYGLFYNLDQVEFVKKIEAIVQTGTKESYVEATNEIEKRIGDKDILTDEDRQLAGSGYEYLLAAAQLVKGDEQRTLLDKAIAWATKYGLDGRLAQERRKAAEPTPTPLPTETFTPTNTPTKTPRPTNTQTPPPTGTLQPTAIPSPSVAPTSVGRRPPFNPDQCPEVEVVNPSKFAGSKFQAWNCGSEFGWWGAWTGPNGIDPYILGPLPLPIQWGRHFEICQPKEGENIAFVAVSCP